MDKYNILIVDDVPVNRKLMLAVLKNSLNNVAFTEAADGLQAMACLEREAFDLVILDLMMPGMDGYEVLSEMKNNKRLAPVPVIVNSAVTDLESIKKTLALGAVDYFTKPITQEQMKVIIPLKVNNALERYAQRKELVAVHLRMKEELKFAAMFQQSLLRGKETYRRLQVHKQYTACEELGGDLYDCLEAGDRDWFLMGDITGHGAAAAMVAAMLKVVFRHAIQAHEDPASVLQEINQTFCSLAGDDANLCFSVFVGMIQGERITFANAGHPYPLLLKHDSADWQLLEQKGYLIGFLKNADFKNQTAVWQPGEAILAYTDGLYEDPHHPEKSKEWKSVLRHALMLQDQALSNPEVFLQSLTASFGKGDQRQLGDDVALLYLKRRR